MRLLLRNPPVASKWIQTIHPKVKNLVAATNEIFKGNTVDDAITRQGELLNKYGKDYVIRVEKTFSRLKANLKKGKAEMTPTELLETLRRKGQGSLFRTAESLGRFLKQTTESVGHRRYRIETTSG